MPSFAVPLLNGRPWLGLGLFDNGSVTAPALAYASEPGLGQFRPSAGVLAWAQGGAEKMRLEAGNLLIGLSTNGVGRLQLPVTSTNAGGITLGADTSLFRTAAGGMAIAHLGGSAPGLLLQNDTTVAAFFGVSTTNVFLDSRLNSSSVILRTTTAGGALTTALTLDSSQNGTFVGSMIGAAGVAGRATLRLPHGVAPTAPVNGDVWTTTAGLFVRINGATVGPLT